MLLYGAGLLGQYVSPNFIESIEKKRGIEGLVDAFFYRGRTSLFTI